MSKQEKQLTNLKFLIESLNIIYQVFFFSLKNSSKNPILFVYSNHKVNIESTLSKYRMKRDGLDIFIITYLCFKELLKEQYRLDIIKRKLYIVAFIFGYSKKELLFLRHFFKENEF